jgi:hypothetical protein
MGSDLEMKWKALAVVLFEVPARYVFGALRNTTKTSGYPNLKYAPLEYEVAIAFIRRIVRFDFIE